ncbi:MAG: hypothetical protein ACI4DK_13370 [Lachnospiraceae bacterium]
MLYDYYKYFVNYLILLYGGSYEIRNSTLFMFCGNDEFYVNLFDGSRFGEYTFFHKNYKFDTKYFHKQFTCKQLEFGMYQCFTHDFNKKYNISYKKEDWKRFEKDALKYKILDIEEGEKNV